MRVEKVGERYRCIVCGYKITVTKDGDEDTVCCGEEMELIG
jgi:desulfoferrodoxin-like iron-binding protein